MKRKFFVVAIFAIVAVPHARATPLFWTISGDPNNFFVPNQLSSANLSPPGVTNLATLGDGSLGFNGGLTVGPGGTLYGIANDSSGSGSLYRIQTDGTLSLVGVAGGLGTGFLGGLTFDPTSSIFYAAVTDSLGNSTLDSITTGGLATALGKSLGTGFSGLAIDTANSMFYGIANDNSNFSTLVRFSLLGSVNNVGALGFGFGALSYDSVNNVFWAIGPVNNSAAQLYQITAAGAESNPLLTLGDGFVELAVQPSSVPEPSTGALMAACLMAGIWISTKRFWRKK